MIRRFLKPHCWRERRGVMMGSWMGCILSLAVLYPPTILAATLEKADVTSLAGNQVAINLSFSGAPPQPSDFATENPARIAIDFPNVSSQLERRPIPIGVGPAQSLVAIEASDRTRVVINLNERVPYSLKTRGNQVIVALNPDTQAASRPARAPLDAAPTARAASGVRGGTLEDIDFRRGVDGEGRVIITLPSKDARVEVSEQGRDVVVEIADTRLPQRLFRRLDVVDFGTPVVAVESRAKGDDIRVDIQTANAFDYLAYQTGNRFTIEFRALTPAEKEELEREKIVYSGDRLSLNFQDIEVRAVLQMIADFTGLNLVASDTVSGNITLRLKNVPWDQALEIILETKGLAMRRAGNVIRVAPAPELAAQEQLQLESRQQLEELAPVSSELLQINYAKASELAQLIKSDKNNLLSERGNVAVDARTNTLFIQDTRANIQALRELVNRLDVPVRQVLIDAQVVIASDDFARDLGVRFGVSGSMGRTGSNELLVGGGMNPGDAGIDGLGSFDTGPYGFSLGDGEEQPSGPFNSVIANDDNAPNLWVNLPAQTPSGAINFLLGKVGSHLITLELSAMQRENRGEIVSSPRVVTSDQNQATISVGTMIPYRNINELGQVTTEFEEATLKLEVTPHITPDGRIIMDLEVNKDSPDYANITPDGVPIEKKSVKTNVLVDNGETIVLGGVFERVKSYEREQVPFVGGLPIIGNLFRSTSRREDNEELLIFVTPKILKSDLAVR